MIPDDDPITEAGETTPPLYKRVWWAVYGSPYYYNRGFAYWRESFYMWLGKRLPAGLVSRAAHELMVFGDERGLRTYDIAEVVSYWDDEKVR